MLGTDIAIINSTGIKADIAPVCSGDEVELIWTISSERVLEWSATLMPPEDMTLEHVVNMVTQIFPIHTCNNSQWLCHVHILKDLSSQLSTIDIKITDQSCKQYCKWNSADRETCNSSSITVNVVHNANMST